MTAKLAHLPAIPPEPEPWETVFTRSLVAAHPHVPAGALAAFALDAGLPGVARSLGLYGVQAVSCAILGAPGR